MIKLNKLLFIIVFLGLSVQLILGAHVISTSQGANYSINESSLNIYTLNITVNNTDTTAIANITNINITLPTTLSFISNTNGTSAGAHVFLNKSSTLTWNNTNLVMNLTWKYFWFNVSVSSPGSYVIIVNTSNTTKTYTTNITFRINDTTIPATISFANPGINSSSNLSKSSIAVNVSATDNGVISDIIIQLFNSTHNQINYTNSTTLKSTFINFTGLAQGNYYVNATVNDTYRNTNYTTTLSILLDTVGPQVVYNCSDSSFYSGDTITCSCTAYDVYDTSPTLSVTGFSTVNVGDNLIATCTATDDAGNVNTSSFSYSVTGSGDYAPGSGGGSSSSTSYTQTFADDSKDFSLIKEITRQLEVKSRTRIKINNTLHTVGVKALTTTTATVEVSSVTQEKVLNLGDEQKFDVTSDGYYDINVKLVSITSNKANLTIKSIYEKVIATTATQKNESSSSESQEQQGTASEGTKTNKTWIVIVIIVIVVLIGWAVYILNKKRR
jgi:hypothetical protein